MRVLFIVFEMHAQIVHVDLLDEGLFEGTFEKVPSSSPKTPQTKGIATHGRKSEHSASLFCAAKGSFRAPLLQYRLGFLPRPLVDFFEASPYGVLANGGGGVILWGAGFCGGLLKKSPRAPPKLPNKRDCYPRKEVRTTRFLFSCGEGEFSFAVTAVQISVCAPPARGLLRSLALRDVGERWQRFPK